MKHLSKLIPLFLLALLLAVPAVAQVPVECPPGTHDSGPIWPPDLQCVPNDSGACPGSCQCNNSCTMPPAFTPWRIPTDHLNELINLAIYAKKTANLTASELAAVSRPVRGVLTALDDCAHGGHEPVIIILDAVPVCVDYCGCGAPPAARPEPGQRPQRYPAPAQKKTASL